MCKFMMCNSSLGQLTKCYAMDCNGTRFHFPVGCWRKGKEAKGKLVVRHVNQRSEERVYGSSGIQSVSHAAETQGLSWD